MATATQVVTVPLEVYLATSYRPDCDWVDGALKERNVGDGAHSALQRIFLKFFFKLEEDYDVVAFPELRTQVSRTHYRVPDVLVRSMSAPFECIVTVAPLLCVEILSPNDSMSEMHDKIDDYLKMGVQAVWVVDPRRRVAWVADRMGFHAVETLQVPGTDAAVALGAMFAELDLLEACGGVENR